MTLRCANCNADNSDGDGFCRNCGRPLATAPAAPVRRAASPSLPGPLLVAGLAGGLILAASLGVLIALLMERPPTNPPEIGGGTTATPTPTATATRDPANPPTPTPTPERPVVTVTPVRPAVTPTPTPTPSAPPEAGGTGDWQTIDVANLSMIVPVGWSVLDQDAGFVQARDPATKSLEIGASGTFEQARTVAEFQQLLIDNANKKYTGVEIATPAEEWKGLPGGRFFALRATETPQSGDAFTVFDVYYIAVQESNYFVWQFIVNTANWDAFKPTYDQLEAPTWKLYRAGT